jgi:iron complex transport system substrate-binding protein
MAVLKLCLSLCLSVLMAGAIGGCQGPSSSNSGQDTPDTDSGRLPVTPLSGQCHIRYAKGFTITYHKTCKVVTVFDPAHPSGETPLSTFILVPRGTRPPVHLAGTVIETPVRRIVLGSISCTPYFSMLGITDRIVGITQGKLVTDPEVAARIRDGHIAEVGVGSGMATQFNIERLLVLHPDLVLSGWRNNPAWAAHIKVQGTGLPVALTADYMESTPLGRAEWMKFIAVFFDADAEAERLFARIEGRYLAMAAKTRAVRHRPTVISGITYQGSWYIEGGQSYFAHLLKDAGATYLWADDHTVGSAPVNIESVLARGLNADFGYAGIRTIIRWLRWPPRMTATACSAPFGWAGCIATMAGWVLGAVMTTFKAGRPTLT